MDSRPMAVCAQMPQGNVASPSRGLYAIDSQRTQAIRAITPHFETCREHRRQIMLARREGLTTTCNCFHNPDESAASVACLNELHVETDRTVAAVYGWSDLDLGHGFHKTAQLVRFTISEAARREVLRRLLELNHQRYAEEVAAGLHEKGEGKDEVKARKEMSKTKPGKATKDDDGVLKLF